MTSNLGHIIWVTILESLEHGMRGFVDLYASNLNTFMIELLAGTVTAIKHFIATYPPIYIKWADTFILMEHHSLGVG